MSRNKYTELEKLLIELLKLKNGNGMVESQYCKNRRLHGGINYRIDPCVSGEGTKRKRRVKRK